MKGIIPGLGEAVIEAVGKKVVTESLMQVIKGRFNRKGNVVKKHASDNLNPFTPNIEVQYFKRFYSFLTNLKEKNPQISEEEQSIFVLCGEKLQSEINADIFCSTLPFFDVPELRDAASVMQSYAFVKDDTSQYLKERSEEKNCVVFNQCKYGILQLLFQKITAIDDVDDTEKLGQLIDLKELIDKIQLEIVQRTYGAYFDSKNKADSLKNHLDEILLSVQKATIRIENRLKKRAVAEDFRSLKHTLSAMKPVVIDATACVFAGISVPNLMVDPYFNHLPDHVKSAFQAIVQSGESESPAVDSSMIFGQLESCGFFDPAVTKYFSDSKKAEEKKLFLDMIQWPEKIKRLESFLEKIYTLLGGYGEDAIQSDPGMCILIETALALIEDIIQYADKIKNLTVLREHIARSFAENNNKTKYIEKNWTNNTKQYLFCTKHLSTFLDKTKTLLENINAKKTDILASGSDTQNLFYQKKIQESFKILNIPDLMKQNIKNESLMHVLKKGQDWIEKNSIESQKKLDVISQADPKNQEVIQNQFKKIAVKQKLELNIPPANLNIEAPNVDKVKSVEYFSVLDRSTQKALLSLKSKLDDAEFNAQSPLYQDIEIEDILDKSTGITFLWRFLCKKLSLHHSDGLKRGDIRKQFVAVDPVLLNRIPQLSGPCVDSLRTCLAAIKEYVHKREGTGKDSWLKAAWMSLGGDRDGFRFQKMNAYPYVVFHAIANELSAIGSSVTPEKVSDRLENLKKFVECANQQIGGHFKTSNKRGTDSMAGTLQIVEKYIQKMEKQVIAYQEQNTMAQQLDQFAVDFEKITSSQIDSIVHLLPAKDDQPFSINLFSLDNGRCTVKNQQLKIILHSLYQSNSKPMDLNNIQAQFTSYFDARNQVMPEFTQDKNLKENISIFVHSIFNLRQLIPAIANLVELFQKTGDLGGYNPAVNQLLTILMAKTKIILGEQEKSLSEIKGIFQKTYHSLGVSQQSPLAPFMNQLQATCSRNDFLITKIQEQCDKFETQLKKYDVPQGEENARARLLNLKSAAFQEGYDLLKKLQEENGPGKLQEENGPGDKISTLMTQLKQQFQENALNRKKHALQELEKSCEALDAIWNGTPLKDAALDSAVQFHIQAILKNLAQYEICRAEYAKEIHREPQDPTLLEPLSLQTEREDIDPPAEQAAPKKKEIFDNPQSYINTITEIMKIKNTPIGTLMKQMIENLKGLNQKAQFMENLQKFMYRLLTHDYAAHGERSVDCWKNHGYTHLFSPEMLSTVPSTQKIPPCIMGILNQYSSFCLLLTKETEETKETKETKETEACVQYLKSLQEALQKTYSTKCFFFTKKEDFFPELTQFLSCQSHPKQNIEI